MRTRGEGAEARPGRDPGHRRHPQVRQLGPGSASQVDAGAADASPDPGSPRAGAESRSPWSQVSAQDPEAVTTVEHWPQRAADWLAPYDNAKGAYPPEMNKTAYDRSLDVIRKLAERHRGDATVWGVEPVGVRGVGVGKVVQ